METFGKQTTQQQCKPPANLAMTPKWIKRTKNAQYHADKVRELAVERSFWFEVYAVGKLDYTNSTGFVRKFNTLSESKTYAAREIVRTSIAMLKHMEMGGRVVIASSDPEHVGTLLRTDEAWREYIINRYRLYLSVASLLDATEAMHSEREQEWDDDFTQETPRA